MSRTSKFFLFAALLGGASLVLWLLPSLLSTDSFMPHGHCYLWMPSLVRLHVTSDGLIGFSYLSISLTLVYVVRRRHDLPFNWMFLAFGLFIIACGCTHFMEVWTLWTPVYWLSGSVKLVTAGASVVTAILLPPLVPKILALPSPSLLTRANADLEREVTERKRAEQVLEAQASSLREQAQLLDLAHDTIMVRALTGVITFWNHAAEEMYGWSKAEAIGKVSSELLKTELPAPIEQIEGEFGHKGFWEGELNQMRRDGARIVILSRWALQRDQGGNPVSALEINRDITEQKRLEAQRVELAREQTRAAMQEEIIRRQRDQLAEMSTPFIPITEQIMVMPLVGTMDEQRAQQVLEAALHGAASHRARAVILDVTGMRQIDTSVAGALIRTASALRLLGTWTALTGIRPEVAQMLVSIGVDLSGLVTCSTLQRGIACALEQTEGPRTSRAKDRRKTPSE